MRGIIEKNNQAWEKEKVMKGNNCNIEAIEKSLKLHMCSLQNCTEVYTTGMIFIVIPKILFEKNC